MSGPRPNILLFITDQHRPDHTGFGGNRSLQTPNLDRLAARSTRFDRAIVANPICMPNRSSILTGRLPSVHRTRYNGIPLDRSANTFARVLRSAGYQTAYFGKSHLQNIGDGKAIRDRVFADETGPNALADPHPPGWDSWEYSDRHRAEYVRIPPDFYGFDQVDLLVDHSDSCSGHYYQWLLEQGVDPTKLQGAENALPFESPTPQIWRTAVPEELYPTSYVSMRTAEFLEGRAHRADEPFLAVCSYPDPHHPFTPPGRYFDMYDPAAIPLPETFSDPHTDSMPHYRAMLERRGEQGFRMAPFAPTGEQYREMAAKEYGMISMIDDGVGRVLDALERSGQADNTVVVFTSDHGDMFGDHGVMLKAGMHYEGCVRVPLTIAAPGRSPGVCRSLVSSLDLAQTFLELAGCDPFRGMQGASLVELLADPTARVRDYVLVEEDQMFDIARVGGSLRMRTLITDEGRLTLYRGSDHGELFALDRDPEERTNLFAKPEGGDLRTALSERLARVLIEAADESPLPTFMA